MQEITMAFTGAEAWDSEPILRPEELSMRLLQPWHKRRPPPPRKKPAIDVDHLQMKQLYPQGRKDCDVGHYVSQGRGLMLEFAGDAVVMDCGAAT